MKRSNKSAVTLSALLALTLLSNINPAVAQEDIVVRGQRAAHEAFMQTVRATLRKQDEMRRKAEEQMEAQLEAERKIREAMSRIRKPLLSEKRLRLIRRRPGSSSSSTGGSTNGSTGGVLAHPQVKP